MASFDSLPIELVCEIVQNVHDSSESSNNIFNISLLNHKLHRAAQDILYKAPRLLKPKPSDTVYWHNRRRHQLKALLRTIIDQPQLAKQIRELDVTVIHESDVCNPWLEQDPEEIKTINLQNESVQSLTCLSSGWETRLRSGGESAICALILALIPSLRYLSINLYHLYEYDQPDQTHALSEGPSFLKAHPLLLHQWYNLQDQGTFFDTSTVAGFSNLTSIRSNARIPYSLFVQKTLKTLDLTSSSFNLGNGKTTLPHITSLTLRAHLSHDQSDPWHQWSLWAGGAARRLASIAHDLPNLSKLRIIIAGKMYRQIEPEFSHLVQNFPGFVAPNLRTLVHDTRAVVHTWDAAAQRPSPVEAIFFHLVKNLAESSKLEKVEVWPGQYEGDAEIMPKLPDDLLEWSKMFKIYIGDDKALRCAGESEVRGERDDRPYRVVYVKE